MLHFFLCCTLFMLHLFATALFLGYTFSTLHFFHLILFSMLHLCRADSCCTHFMLHFYRATLFSCFTFSVLYSIHVALSSCCALFRLYFFRVALLPSVLYFFHLVLFSFCNFFLLHSFYIAPFLVMHCSNFFGFYVFVLCHVPPFLCCTLFMLHLC